MVITDLQVTVEATRRPSGSSGIVGKRKQSTPRCVVSRTCASQVSAKAPAANNQRQGIEEPRQEEPSSPQERVLPLLGILTTGIPNTESLNRLQKSLQENQPYDLQQVN